MAWIESHTSLARHPKTIRLAKMLELSMPATIGHLHLLWWWALEYAPEGDLSGLDPQEVAEAGGFAGEGEAFVSALHRARFLDDDGHLHDWDDYAGRLLARRRTEAERLRRWRAEQRDDPPPSIKNADETRTKRADETRTSGVTVPNRTGPNRTGPDPLRVSELVLNSREESPPSPAHAHALESTGTFGADTPPARPTSRASPPAVDEPFRARMVSQYAETLGGAEVVRETIELALSHQNARKYQNPQLYVQRWLRDDARAGGRSYATTRGHAPPRPSARGAGSSRAQQRFIDEPDDGFLASCGL